MLLGLLLGLPARAHEFWISPEHYMVAPGEQLSAHLRVGERFKGGSYSYLPQKFRRFDLVVGGEIVAVDGTIGDRPALAMAAPGDGLVTVVHQTTDYSVTYSDPEKFPNFVRHKDFEGVLARHAERGLPDTGFREQYSRHAKSLIAVGRGVGQDITVGLETEIVALANPYTDDLTGGLPVLVLYRGAPRVGVQVELFEKAADGAVEVTLHRTDALGRAVRAGYEYLVDAVVMRPMEQVEQGDPVWESLWASLTFLAPAR